MNNFAEDAIFLSWQAPEISEKKVKLLYPLAPSGQIPN